MYLFGAGGHAKVIIDILRSIDIQVEGIFDDNPAVKYLLDYKVSCVYNQELTKNSKMIVSIGDNRTRSAIVNKLDCIFGNGYHKNAIISTYATVGAGTVVMQNAVIQSGTVIGRHVIVNTAAIVEHDCELHDFVHISPNATVCGNVLIGEGTQIGAGAIIIPGIKIGRWSIVGAGCVVIEDVPDHVVYVGNPGKIIKTL
jgi:sugar O-acyltransferase (sialic acid O-acetyltransferase NeuD family)